MDIGATIKEQYQVVEHIGRGGMADVWSAKDTRLRRLVAIKTIAASMSRVEDPLALFEREAQTIAQMEHPHILPIYDFGDYDHSLYIVMRYVTGGSLEDRLEMERPSVHETLHVLDAVAKALDYAHDNNVIHLDLKPGNILLDGAGSPYLADFGLATVLDPEGRARNPGSGTLLYMAPEQLTAETIDHRADIYSFSVMAFHLLTGQLPFEGRAPLAMRQLQGSEELPDVDEIIADLPYELSDILRVGTAAEPDLRYDSHLEMVQAMRAVLTPDVDIARATQTASAFQLGGELLGASQLHPDASPELIDAVDLFNRARQNWHGGQGRFLLGVTHFTLIADTYRDAAYHELTIDEEGHQVLLRGALEYDYQLDYWWRALTSDDSRRWVCLHALRNGTAPARIRALYRLETLPDERQAPVIPRSVAQALDTETDHTAKLAALTVLRTRAKLLKDRSGIKIKTDYRGRLLSSMTRIGIQMRQPAIWQETVYGENIDLLIAETTFDPNPEVAEAAARTIGQIRSLTAVRYLSDAQRGGQGGALDALALVRDEAPALPDEVSRQARTYAWLTNTVNRLTTKPLEGIWRVALVLLAGWLAMGEQVYNLFRSQQLFSAQRWGNTIAVGAVFGVLIALTYVAGFEMNRRLRGFWSWWQRLLVFGALGFGFATLSYGGFNWMYYQFDPPWDLMRVGGAGLAFGLVASALLNLRPWFGVALTALMTFLPIYASYGTFYEAEAFTIVPGLLILLLVGVFCGGVAAQRSPVTAQVRLLRAEWVQWLLGTVLGVGWTLSTWFYIFQAQAAIAAGDPLTWDAVMVLSVGIVSIGIAAGYWFKPISRWFFGMAAALSFIGVYAVSSWRFFDLTMVLPLLPDEPLLTLTHRAGQAVAPIPFDTIFYFDDPTNIFTVTLPMVLVIALGAHGGALLQTWWGWVGEPRSSGLKRGEWLSVLLPYALVVTALVSVLALFSLKVNIGLALFWSAWGFVTFVCILAVWRWAKWGADVLLLSGAVMLVGAFAYDILTMYDSISTGRVPGLLQTFPIMIGVTDTPLFTPNALVLWSIWSGVLGVCVWGMLRRALWGGIGAALLLLIWYALAIFSPMQGSVASLAMVHLAIFAFALRPIYHLLEPARFPLFRTAQAPAEVETVLAPAMPLSQRITARQEQITVSAPIVDVTTDIATTEEQPVQFDIQDEAEGTNYTVNNVAAIGDTAAEAETSLEPQVRISTEKLHKRPSERTTEVPTQAGSDAPTKPVTDQPVIRLDVGKVRTKPKTARLPNHDDEAENKPPADE